MPDKATEIVTEAKQILEKSKSEGMKFTGNGYRRIDRQVNCIVAIAKYKFKWRRSTLFRYILNTFPELEDRLTPREMRYSITSALYQIMDGRQKSTIIKRLDQIQKRNKTLKRVQGDNRKEPQ